MVVESRPARDGEPLRGGRGTVGRGSGKASASARSGSDPRRGTARGGAAGEGRGGGAAQRGTARGGVAGEGRRGGRGVGARESEKRGATAEEASDRLCGPGVGCVRPTRRGAGRSDARTTAAL